MDHHRPPRAGKFKFGGNVGKVDLVLQRRLQTNLPFQLYSATVLVTPSNATLTPGQYHKCTTCIIYEPLCTACATIVPPVLVPPAVEDGSSTPPHLLQRPLVTCVLCIHYHRHISSPLFSSQSHYPTTTMASVRMTFHHH